MQIDAVAGKEAQPLQNRRGLLHSQHAQAQFLVGGVDRNVQRRKALRGDPFQVRLAQIGRGDIVSVGEGHAEIAVLEVQRRAQPRRILVDETEDATVVAAADWVFLERDSQVLLIGFSQPRAALPPFAVEENQTQRLVGGEKQQIDIVAHRAAIDGNQPRARRQPRAGGGRAGRYANDQRAPGRIGRSGGQAPLLARFAAGKGGLSLMRSRHRPDAFHSRGSENGAAMSFRLRREDTRQ
ncbi:MAG: hypothetical protein BWZ10_01836 [candidate division BRC1 bacterium ADurb.BinA364]|nr:MAG: hypothetical protein BWZ10_01836 [candidate division BRC1 bacterium ADurb.BinA364]